MLRLIAAADVLPGDPYSHPVATALCLMCGLFGGAMLLAFFTVFSSVNLLGRGLDVTKRQKRGFWWWYLLSDWSALGEIWKETKGLRWLFPVGLLLCITSYAIYRLYLSETWSI